MADDIAKRDPNRVTTILGVTDDVSADIKRLLVDASTGRLKVTAVISAGGGITSLNTLTAAAQTLAVGTAGTDFAVVSATATHTFNLPNASTTNRGALISADWDTFNAKVDGLGTVTDNRLVRTSLTTGKVLQESGITIDDSDNVSNVGTLGVGAITTTGVLAMGTNKITGLGDPTTAQDAATKEYVDMAISFIDSFFLNDTISNIGGIYDKMLELPTGEGESTFTLPGVGAGDDQPITNWATDPGIPGVTNLKAGVYMLHIHAEKTAGDRDAQIYFELYTRTDPGGAETLRATSEISDLITAKTSIELHTVISSDVDILATDRLILKMFANITGGSQATTVVLYAEGTDNSRFDIPTTTEVLSSVFVRQDGTTTMTGDLEMDDAAGPKVINEAATTTNPTLVPNKAEEDTGIGWASDTLHLVLGGSAQYSFSGTTFNAGGNNITNIGIMGVTGTRITKGWFTDLEVTNAPTLGGVAIPSISSTDTLTNKRITSRVTTEASSATPTINSDNSDAHSITALATAITSMTTNLTGTPTNFQKLIIRILDNATGRAITWGAKFEDRGVALPTTTTSSKLLTVGFIYDTVDAIWGCVAVADET